ncbi:7-cyano-7-deazaguanine synthase [Vibrio parahaemolyticus]
MANKFLDDASTVVLVSGGPDSATLVKFIRNKQKKFGQKLNAVYLKTGVANEDDEISKARSIVEADGGSLEVIDITGVVGHLSGKRVMMHAGAEIATFGHTMVMAIMVTHARAKGYQQIAIGLHKDDAFENYEYSGEHLDNLQKTYDILENSAPKFYAPFSELTKKDVFKLGLELGVNFENTWSCTEGIGTQCGMCGACLARHEAFISNGLTDPTEYDVKPDLNLIDGPVRRNLLA